MSDFIITGLSREKYLPATCFIGEKNISDLFKIFPVQVYLNIKFIGEKGWLTLTGSSFFKDMIAFCQETFVGKTFTFYIFNSLYNNGCYDWNRLNVNIDEKFLLGVFLQSI